MHYLEDGNKEIINVDFEIIDNLADKYFKPWIIGFWPKNVGKLYFYYFCIMLFIIMLGLLAEIYLPPDKAIIIIDFVNKSFSLFS